MLFWNKGKNSTTKTNFQDNTDNSRTIHEISGWDLDEPCPTNSLDIQKHYFYIYQSQNNPPLQLVFNIQHLQTDWPQISIIWILAGATVKAVLVITGGPLLAAEPCPSVETGTLWSRITQSAGAAVQTLVHTAQRLYTSTADGAFPLIRAPVTKVAFIILASHIYFLSF